MCVSTINHVKQVTGVVAGATFSVGSTWLGEGSCGESPYGCCTQPLKNVCVHVCVCEVNGRLEWTPFLCACVCSHYCACLRVCSCIQKLPSVLQYASSMFQCFSEQLNKAQTDRMNEWISVHLLVANFFFVWFITQQYPSQLCYTYIFFPIENSDSDDRGG